MPYSDVIFGETTQIGCRFVEYEGRPFTIVDAKVTIVDGENVIRDHVDASIDGKTVFFLETFSAENGYQEGKKYTATFKVTIDCDGTTYVEKHEDTFTVLGAADE